MVCSILISATHLSFVEQARNVLVRATINAGVENVVNGGNLGEGFLQALKISAIDTLGANIANKIRDSYDLTAEKIVNGKDPLEYALHKIAHGALGCAIGGLKADSGSGCVAGATGAVVGEIIGEAYLTKWVRERGAEVAAIKADNTLTYEQKAQALREFQSNLQIESDILKNKGVNMAKLGAGLAAFVTGQNVDTAADTAENAVENNAACVGACIGLVIIAGMLYFGHQGDGNVFKGLGVFQRGEDPLSQAVASGINTAVELSMEKYPGETLIVLGVIENISEVISEDIEAIVTFADNETGNRVSVAWNKLPKDTRDSIAGGFKAVSFIVPGAAAGKLGKGGKAVGGSAGKYTLQKVNLPEGSVERIGDLIDKKNSSKGGGSTKKPSKVTDDKGSKITIQSHYAHHKKMREDVVEQLKKKGYTVSEKEVSFGSSCGTGRCRPDIIYKTTDGKTRIIEIKTGNADLSIRQSEIYPQIKNGEAIPRGNIAFDFDLEVGVPLKDQGYPNGIPIEIMNFPGVK